MIVIIAIIAWACHSVAGKENAYSTSCNTLGMLKLTPGKSCDDIYQFNKASRGASGNYWINTNTGIHQIYCDMELECGGHKGGWMRIADLDANRGDNCPSGWTKITTPVAACIGPSGNPGCYSANFSTHHIPYSKVCGKAVDYHKGGGPDAFLAYQFTKRSINGPYVDGLSITYGIPRKHIWTYAIGYTDKANNKVSNCPCSQFPGTSPPSYVHENYYCESGRMLNTLSGSVSGVFTDDPLWDGKGCSTDNSCCSEPNLPWFYRQMPLTASEDIETRLCHDEQSSDENVLIKELILYVQ